MSSVRAFRAFALLSIYLAASGIACADRTTQEAAGATLYRRYCASCHGVSGAGDGPLAASLHAKPTDLTVLARRAGGKFDEAAVMMAIDGRLLVEAHGPRDMPIWGVVFQQEHVGEPFAIYGPTLDARALADYLHSIQKP